MTWWEAVVLGLVEGITEYLPVSSTGHLIITSSLLGLDEPPELKSAVDAFNVAVQGGAILAVLGLYWPRVVRMLAGLIGRDAGGRRLLVNLVVAFMPAGVLGFLFADAIEARLFNPTAVLAALLLGGVWMIWIDARRRKKAAATPGVDAADLGAPLDEMTWRQALIIGFFQCVAMWPGTSRSMMTIAGGTIVGIRPRDAAEFSFLLGLPTLGGACVYTLGKSYLRSRGEGGEPMFIETIGWTPTLVGLGVATVSAALAIRWLVGFLNRHGLAPFGWYRIGLCAVFGALLWAGAVSL